MKKLFILPLALGLLLASCDDEPNQPTNTVQQKGQLPTCIIPLNTDDDSKVILTDEPTYAQTCYLNNGVWVLSASNINLPGFPTIGFETPGLSYSGTYNALFTYGGEITGDNNTTITNFVSAYIQLYNYYTGEATVNGFSPLGSALSTMSFTVKDQCMVRAFPKMCYYAGALVTTYKDAEGVEQSYTDRTPQIGVKVNMSSRTADISIHNVKFAPAAPALSIVTLSNVPIQGDVEDGYKIVGKNIVPSVGLGASAVPYPNFTFDEFEMHPTNSQMTMAEFDFKVAGKYKGEFTGSIVRDRL